MKMNSENSKRYYAYDAGMIKLPHNRIAYYYKITILYPRSILKQRVKITQFSHKETHTQPWTVQLNDGFLYKFIFLLESDYVIP